MKVVRRLSHDARVDDGYQDIEFAQFQTAPDLGVPGHGPIPIGYQLIQY